MDISNRRPLYRQSRKLCGVHCDGVSVHEGCRDPFAARPHLPRLGIGRLLRRFFDSGGWFVNESHHGRQANCVVHPVQGVLRYHRRGCSATAAAHLGLSAFDLELMHARGLARQTHDLPGRGRGVTVHHGRSSVTLVDKLDRLGLIVLCVERQCFRGHEGRWQPVATFPELTFRSNFHLFHSGGLTCQVDDGSGALLVLGGISKHVIGEIRRRCASTRRPVTDGRDGLGGHLVRERHVPELSQLLLHFSDPVLHRCDLAMPVGLA
mmetsp:Transcript_62855/g.175137  ORF Transcript_62855/g.175137 Transcript_62855/m.175137 type:complete len:265 (-) Transcript_62855:756-1550(-)